MPETVPLQFVRSGAYSPDGISQIHAEAGTVDDVPFSVAKSLVEGGKAVPAVEDPPDDLPRFGGEEVREAETVLRKHDLTVRSVPDDEDVVDLQERHKDLTARLEEAEAERDKAGAKAERLRRAYRDARIGELTGEESGDAPDREEVERAEATAREASEKVEVIREALQKVSDRMAAALDEAHNRADRDAREAHAALCRKAVDRGRKFRAIVEDLIAFEEAYSGRIGARRVGSFSGLDNWISEAENRT